MVIVGILGRVLADMWGVEVNARSADKFSLIAFYLAQAGIERGKVEIVYDVTLSGPQPDSINWFLGLDKPGDNYTFQYKYFVNSGSNSDERILRGVGEVVGANGNLVAHREITITVSGIEDANGDGIDDNREGDLVSGSWEEI